jgi:hypothetical protein
MILPGGKELRALPVAASAVRPAQVQLQLLVFGMPVATEQAAPHLVRLLAGELLQAADAAEGGAL